jgi:hypothetical protein
VLTVIDDFGTPLFLNRASIERSAAQAGVPPEEYEETLGYDTTASREVEPGRYEIVVPADAYALAFIGTAAPDGASVAWESSVPIFLPPDDDEETTVEVGGTLDGILEFVESYDNVVVDLTAGETVEIAVRSAVGDPSFELAAPGQPLDEGEFVDDSGEGLYGLDAVTTYTPAVSGPHRIRIASSDGLTMAWTLTVTPA